MEHSRLRKPALSQSERTLPGDRAFLAATAECTPPMPEHSIPEFAEAVEVPRYRVVVEVALHHRTDRSVELRNPRKPQLIGSRRS